MGTARRMAGVLAGVVLGGATVGLGVAHADGIVWGCPAGYTLAGTTCRSADGSTVGALGLLPGDVDPVTGAVLLPGTPEAEPTDPAPAPLPTTTAPRPTTTAPATTAPVTTMPAPGSTPAPPVGRPCVTTTPAVGNAEAVRTAAAVDEARARLAADVRRGAPPAVIRADAQALATAIRAHAAALTPPRTPAACPTR